MSGEGIDLGPTGWALERQREKELVDRITVAAAPELARRSSAAESRIDLTRWLAPALAAAALLAAISVTALQRIERDQPPRGGGTADALNLPSPVAEWIARDTPPAMGELIVVMTESED